MNNKIMRKFKIFSDPQTDQITEHQIKNKQPHLNRKRKFKKATIFTSYNCEADQKRISKF